MAGAASQALLKPTLLFAADAQTSAPVRPLRFASIGTGVRGCQLLQASLLVPGVECVAVADLYDGRHIAAREALKKDVPATRDYKELLARPDIDAVIVATMDHQHRQVVEDVCAAGKDVYCEKPMAHTIEDGFAMVAAAQKNNRILQVGSQRVSSILYGKAKEFYDSGRLGKVYDIRASWDRNSASGAWVYPIPPDASEQTIDWQMFLRDAPKRPFDPVRFFRWRCYRDYGEGLAGDLYVHLLSGIQFITGINTAPSRAQATGGLYRWKDGRDYPDVLETLYDYPDFRVSMRCNLNNEQGEFIGFYGDKGTVTIHDTVLTFTPQDLRPQPENYSTIGWPEKLRNEYLEQWHKEHPEAGDYQLQEESEVYALPKGYDDVVDHEKSFFNAVRTRKSPVENEVFGNNTSIACHMANYSYFNQKPAVWDAAARKIKS
ncbi:MAG: Gfo/Idh/MocA family protein [Acidobacteriaceae bacterium]